MKPRTFQTVGRVIALSAGIVMLAAAPTMAHCDAIDGPVVTAARQALEAGEVTPVLKWVAGAAEAEVRTLFAQTLAVRALGPEATALADRHFFENVVRIHRAGEGAPYTGLQPAGTPLEPAVAAVDRALGEAEVAELLELVTGQVREGLVHRFARAVEARRHAEESVGAGREFVAAYAELVHYADRLYLDASTNAAHAAVESATAEHPHE